MRTGPFCLDPCVEHALVRLAAVDAEADVVPSAGGGDGSGKAHGRSLGYSVRVGGRRSNRYESGAGGAGIRGPR